MMMMMMVNMMVMIMRRIPRNEGEEGERKDKMRKDEGDEGDEGERKEGLLGRKECRSRRTGEGCAGVDNCLLVQSLSVLCCIFLIGPRIDSIHLFDVLCRIIMHETGDEEQQSYEFDVCGVDNFDMSRITMYETGDEEQQLYEFDVCGVDNFDRSRITICLLYTSPSPRD